jgi:hypothetical protein
LRFDGPSLSEASESDSSMATEPSECGEPGAEEL